MKIIEHFLLLLTAFVMLTGCSATVSTTIVKKYDPLDYRQEVYVVGLHQSILVGQAQELGEIKIGDSGFSTDCDYETVIEKAKNEARKIGGNVVKITDHRFPSALSTCHRIQSQNL